MKPIAFTSSGHYSAGIIHNGLLFVSGQLPLDPQTKTRPAGGIEAETLQALQNLEAVLLAGGSSRERVLKTTVYVADITLWPQVNAVYAAFFGVHKPARSIVPTGPLHFGCLIEIEAIAAVDDQP